MKNPTAPAPKNVTQLDPADKAAPRRAGATPRLRMGVRAGLLGIDGTHNLLGIDGTHNLLGIDGTHNLERAVGLVRTRNRSSDPSPTPPVP
jgi:hypothetical protein